MLLLLGLACAAFAPVPHGGITLHISILPSEIHLLRSVSRRIVWPLHQCFSTVVVAIDQPGGKTYSSTRTAPPKYITPQNISVDSRRIKDNMAQSMRLLATQCRKPLLQLDFGGRTPYFTGPPTHPMDDPAFADNASLPREQRFFKNTQMYTRALVETRSAYIVHADIDTTGLTLPPVAHGRSMLRMPNFVRQAVHELVKDPRLLFVMPGRRCKSAYILPYPVSCRLFVSMPARFKTMLPLRYWASHVEDMLRYNMERHRFTGLMIEASTPCVASTYLARWLFGRI